MCYCIIGNEIFLFCRWVWEWEADTESCHSDSWTVKVAGCQAKAVRVRCSPGSCSKGEENMIYKYKLGVTLSILMLLIVSKNLQWCPKQLKMFVCLDGSHPDVLWINKIRYKRIRQTRLVYLLVAEFATYFDPAGSSSGLYVNQVMLKNCVHLWDPIDVY